MFNLTLLKNSKNSNIEKFLVKNYIGRALLFFANDDTFLNNKLINKFIDTINNTRFIDFFFYLNTITGMNWFLTVNLNLIDQLNKELFLNLSATNSSN